MYRKGRERTVIESFDGSEFVIVGVHEFSELGHELAAISTGALEAPCCVHRVARRLDCTIDVRGRRKGDLGDRLAVGRVDNAESVLGYVERYRSDLNALEGLAVTAV